MLRLVLLLVVLLRPKPGGDESKLTRVRLEKEISVRVGDDVKRRRPSLLGVAIQHRACAWRATRGPWRCRDWRVPQKH